MIDAVGKANARNLSQAGAFIRRSARSSLRRRKRVSAAGEPPSVHTHDPVATLKNIWFVFDPRRLSVVVGPLKLDRIEAAGKQSRDRAGAARTGWRGDRREPEQAATSCPSTLARPFMGPAMERELAEVRAVCGPIASSNKEDIQ